MQDLDITQLKTDFGRDGYVVIRNFLSADELTELTERAVARSDSLFAQRPPEKTFGRNILKGLEANDPYFQRQLLQGRHVPIIESLIDEKPQPASAAWLNKAETDTPLGAHIDADNGATIWIALDPTDENNGCLYYARGSHRKPTEKHKLSVTARDIAELNAQETAVAAVLAPGDASIHSSRTLHWSGVNPSGRPRRAVAYFYQRRKNMGDKSRYAGKE